MYIGLDGLLAELIVATRGIAAGSASATFERWCLLRRAIHSLQIEYPRSTIWIHVDDLCLTTVEDSVDEALTQADCLVTRAVEELTTKEGLPFASDKTFVIASSLHLASAAARVMLPYVTVADSVRRLGVDSGL